MQEFVHWLASNHGALSQQPLSSVIPDIQVRDMPLRTGRSQN